MVDWLNELLFLTETEQQLFFEFQMELRAGPSLVARVGGTPGEITRSHIKAATFHDLTLVREQAGWSTVITFDV
jgi:SHS2 domain-containing protein